MKQITIVTMDTFIHFTSYNYMFSLPFGICDQIKVYFTKTDPNHTSGKIKLTPSVGSSTVILLVLTISTTQTT